MFPVPLIWTYMSVLTKWAEVMVPSGMSRALFRGWVHQATTSASSSPIVAPLSGGANRQKSSTELSVASRESDVWL